MRNKIDNSDNVLNTMPGTPKVLKNIHWFITIISNCQLGNSKWPYTSFYQTFETLIYIIPS